MSTNPVAVLTQAAADAVGTIRRSGVSSVAREGLASAASAALYPLGFAPDALDAVIDAVVGPPLAENRSTPVVLVHGYGSIKSHWLALHVALRRAGYSNVSAINYHPLVEDIPAIAGRLVALVDELLTVPTPEGVLPERVHLVGHSMGGLVIRYAVEVLGLGNRVDVAVTALSPHKGSPWAHAVDLVPGFGLAKRFVRRARRSAEQMQPGSLLLQQMSEAAALNALCGSHDVVWVAFQGGADVVVPADAAVLDTPGAVNIHVEGLGHIDALVSAELIDAVVAQLSARETPVIDRCAVLA